MARIIIVAVSCFVMAAVAMERLSFADSIDWSKESSSKVFVAAETVERDEQERFAPAPSIPIPNTVEDHDSTVTGTLELRLGDSTCPGVAPLTELASKCQRISSAPLKFKVTTSSQRNQ